MNERCEFSDLDMASCAHCQGHDLFPEVKARRHLLQQRAWFPARYDGKCSGCGDFYQRGMAIRSDGAGWLAECCAEEQA